FTFGCLPWLLLPAASDSPQVEVGAFTLAYFLIRTGLGIWVVLVLSLRQAITPFHLLGRVGASLRLISYGLGALGPLLGGILRATLGLRPTLWLAAGGFVTILVITLTATPLPRVRSIPSATDLTADA